MWQIRFVTINLHLMYRKNHSDLHDYLSNNLIIDHYCSFDITKELPSYAKFTRFIREFDNKLLQAVMQSQVLKSVDLTLIDTYFIALDATPVKANVSDNNPKSFRKNKFSKAEVFGLFLWSQMQPVLVSVRKVRINTHII